MTDASEKNYSYKALTITAIKEQVPGFKTFTFNADDAKAIGYKAGQYLTFVHKGHGQETRRSYSITSSPELNEPLAIGVKRVDNGFFSRKLVDEAKVGDTLTTIGATGLFTLPADAANYRQFFFLAAGSGITPVLSLLKSLLHTTPATKAVLIYSSHAPEQILFGQELEQLKTQFPDRLRLEFLLSTSADLLRARLHKDLLQELLRQYAVAPYQRVLFYLCGPTNYMRMCYYALRQAKVPGSNIRRESFSTAKVTAPVLPPDTQPHTVTVHTRQSTSQLAVQYPETILQRAKKAGIPLPYSCEAGKCGSCAVRCLQGKVWMSYNEVLTERDVANGVTLTCVGYPVGGDVVIELL